MARVSRSYQKPLDVKTKSKKAKKRAPAGHLMVSAVVTGSALPEDELMRLAFVWAEQDRVTLADAWPEGSAERARAKSEYEQLKAFRTKRWGRTKMEAIWERAEPVSVVPPKALPRNHAMSDKPIITLSKPLGLFLMDGVVISDTQARELWDAGTADWSQAAFRLMASKVLV